MTDDVLFRRGTTRRGKLRLAPGAATPWHHAPLSSRINVLLVADNE